MCLEKIPHISVTTDLWKNTKLEYFLTITGHFLTNEFQYVSLVLSFKKFKSSHHAVNISEFIKKELEKLNILKKVVSITSDNEASIVRACKDIDVLWLSCLNHILNLVVKHSFQLWKRPNK